MPEAGYSGTPLLKKLGVKSGQKALLIDVPEAVGPLSSFDGWASVRRMKGAPSTGGPFDYIHIFASSEAAFAAAAPKLKARLSPAGMIWASWPKKASGVESDLDENGVRRIALDAGLVDIKVCAIDAVWSGLKLVIPVRNRPND